ncbi:MAG: lamin tail domain-containing protein [Alphaproteobacteria bacterium]|nr:lamin tail domain-containing protein [Alphaproteobacteria bacterium]MCB9672784.1 lamin tail domain-containing protein [Alphaproteobacteria bacterium]MCB9694712.1 lamin tail domain-containing protein [Alphaproteobacteria bacterium]
MLFLSALCAHAAIVINELLPDPAGTDGGNEWVELHNSGAAPVDLAGWQVEAGTSSLAVKHTFAPVSIPAGGFLLLGEELVPADVVMAPGARLGLGNAGSSGDAVRLLDAAGNVVDTVIYGPDNSDGFVDDAGAVPSVVPPVPSSGVSLARAADGADTNTASDWVPLSPPTPGAPNGGAAPSCDPASAGVRINELLPDPAGTDTDAEWVELVATQGAVDISGWVIASGTSDYTALATLPPGTFIAGGDVLLVGQSALSSPDVVAPGFSLGNASNADAVQLRDCTGAVADTVVYGTSNTDGWLDDTGALASLAPRPGSGESIGRVDGIDTDDSTADFLVLFATPGEPNVTEPPDCGGLGSGLVVNELLVNPEGTDDGLEWVELFHAGLAPIDLDGWEVQSATSSSWTARITFGPLTLEPGGRLLVGGSAVPGRTHDLQGTLGNGTGGDGVRVVDCAGFPADTVIYGADNTDGLVDDLGEAARSLAPLPPEGSALQRVEDGHDTDQSGLDFVVAPEATPGAPNIPFEPLACELAGGVRINEVLPDPDGVDDGLEWIELHNSGPSAVRLDGWALAAGTSDYAVLDVVFPADTTIPAGGFVVVGGALVPEVDVVAEGLSVGNGSTSRDGVRLFDCEGTPVDTVVYGPPAEDDPEPGIVDDADTVAPPYGDPASGLSIARVQDGVDTDLAADWRVGRPTPGSSNVFEATPGTSSPDVPRGCGAGDGPRDLTPPPGGPQGQAPTRRTGCRVAPAPMGALVLAALLALRRRVRARV